MDVLRSFSKSNTAPSLFDHLEESFAIDRYDTRLSAICETLLSQTHQLQLHLSKLLSLSSDQITVHIKSWCDRSFVLYRASLLVDAAQRGITQHNGRSVCVLRQFMRRHFSDLNQLLQDRTSSHYDEIALNRLITAEQALTC